MRHMAERMQNVQAKMEGQAAIEHFLRETNVSPDVVNGYLESLDCPPIDQKLKLHKILLRPQVNTEGLRQAVPHLDEFLNRYDKETIVGAEISIKYESYIEKEKEMVDKMIRLEDLALGDHFDYHQMPSLSSEARTKLTKIKPRTLGQASRISGVSPSDISVLLIHAGR